MGSETELSRDIQRALSQLGIWVIRVQSGRPKRRMHCAEAGTPDLVCPALALWLEVKAPKGALEASQVAWHQRATREGVNVAVVRSVSESIAAVTARKRERDSDLRGTARPKAAPANGVNRA